MKGLRQVMCLGLAGILAVTGPGAALGATPEFGRSAEEWATLRDDVIEYGEIGDLVHEYNATVKKNQIDLNTFRKDYGETNEEWSNRYRELADDLEGNLVYPDVDDAGYATMMASIVSSEQTIKQMRETADDSMEDYMTYYYDFSGAEALLVSQAQTGMINYYLNQLKLQTDQKKLELQEEALRSAVSRRDLGLGTEVQVLTAQENIKNAQKAIQDDQSAIDTGKQRLQVLLGWTHDANPEVREIPQVDMERIAAMNPDADKVQAVENSFSMKSNKRKLENARSQDKKDDLQETIREAEQSISASVYSSYQSVLAAQAAFELSQAQAALEQKNYETAERQFQLGNVSRMDYVTRKNTAETARINVETARLNLFQAVQAYDWMLNGLAGGSQGGQS